FLSETVTPSVFVDAFFTLWKLDCDEEYKQTLQWERPFDEELIRQRMSGLLAGDQFSEQWQHLWGWTPEGKALRNVLGRVFTTCDVYNEDDNRAPYELDEIRFRSEIQSLLVELKAANKAVNPSGGSGGN
ncbi:MAG: hypothetical protein Q8M16_24425, partial [Pirellulaceae bacterium]|nr:hypothetical protein [Pirellulaceae bacterium]